MGGAIEGEHSPLWLGDGEPKIENKSINQSKQNKTKSTVVIGKGRFRDRQTSMLKDQIRFLI